MLIKRVFSLMTIIAIIVIMTIIGKIEVFLSVTEWRRRRFYPKISFFLGKNIYGRSTGSRRGNLPMEHAEMPQQVMEVCIILPSL